MIDCMSVILRPTPDTILGKIFLPFRQQCYKQEFHLCIGQTVGNRNAVVVERLVPLL